MASPMGDSARNGAEHVLDSLLQRIRDRSAIVGVVGLGYVGLPLAVEKAKVGFHVVGIDQNEKRAAMVRRGENYISDVRDDELRDLVSQGQIEAESDFARVPELDVIVIAVPTPLTRNLTPDLHYVENVTRAIAKQIRPGQLVSLESTTYPGTTEELMLPILESSGLRVEESFFLAHSPERVDPGNKRYTTKNTSKVVGGVGPRSLQAAMEFYGQTIQHMVPVSSAKAAELVKVFENTFRAVNIAMVNELAMLCHGMNLNVWEVLDAAFTKPFGIMPFYPGPGVGGHCIPIDPHFGGADHQVGTVAAEAFEDHVAAFPGREGHILQQPGGVVEEVAGGHLCSPASHQGIVRHVDLVGVDAPADAVLAASIFHYNEYTIPETKAYLAVRGVPVRL